MHSTIRLTTKRQATFPVRLCDELGVGPGDELQLVRREVHGEIEWVIQPRAPLPTPWFGALRPYAREKSHDMESIRRSIARNRAEEP